ncbi:glycosyltransferase [Sphingomonas sp. SRS2]|uniref:glycosyltransferase n=1 Tax=Sphingomonas sp. SRS2 TaxID=133190 RepID=UPI000696D58F|nr:glycosyltransferase [Sphingomonas sp. SRS2]
MRSALSKANAARDVGDWRAAGKHYRRFLRHRPDDFAIWVQLGHMMAESGDSAAADQAYRAAYDLNPRNADLALCRGHLARRMGDVAQAIVLYRESLALDGNDHAAAALAELTSPGFEIDGVSPQRCGGVLQGWFGRDVSGVLFGDGDDSAWVEFRVGERLVGQAVAEADDDGALVFRATLDVDLGDNGEGVEVVARRMPDGVELEASPVLLFPPSRHPTDHPVAWGVPCEVVKPLTLPVDSEIVLFVTHSRSGKIKPHVLPYLRALKAQGLGIFLIAAVDRPVDLPADLIALTDALIVRRNAGYDFGAWSHAFKLHPRLYGAATLYLVNDSVFPATRDARIGAIVDRIRASKADLIGLTESHEWRWHVQSYFLAIKPRLLASRGFHGFMDDLRMLTRKDHVIRAYEVRLGEMAERDGFDVEILFPSATAINPALFGWRQLITDGLPLVKLLLLHGEFKQADIEGWQAVLADAGFDVALAEATLTAAAETGPVDDGGRLIARRLPGETQAGAPLRISFFGPWNYDNGLGHASRGIIGAIRRTGALVNLHPIKQPFHIHKPLAPPVDILDFEGRADIAVVHLNPDSWHLLTDWQRGSIAEAGRRIGYWVWEMGHIPPAWRRNFVAVDRIWAPSRYCADLFAAQGEAPVDVVPHVVPLSEPRPLDRARALARLGLPADRRTILYIFDGSSYLVRKNPAALVRAFSASGLAARGWSLILKTKHLNDRPEEGAAFHALAEETEGVVLIDRAMAADELADLTALADLYASPHCSEGFGLTIAEAMAAGKPVVATDFGGSRDFLDANVGWPVKWHAWRLDQDFGHYTEGGQWARIDEPALSATLIRAADSIEAGDGAKGRDARERIGELLSHEAVAAKVAASFAAVVETPADAGGVHIPANLSAGVPVERAVLGPALSIVALAPDGALDIALPEDLPTSRDQWIVLAPRGAILAPLFERAWRDAAETRPDVGIFYGDDFAANADRGLDQLRLKPAFDLTLLAAQDYIGAPLIIRASLLSELGLRVETGAALLDDLLLRAHHAGVSIERIPQVLLAYPDARPRIDPAVRKAMLESQPLFAHYRFSAGRAAGSWAQWRDFGRNFPAVSLIVPTRRSKLPGARSTYVERLLKAIAKADWPMDRLTVIVGDDVAGEPAWAKQAWPFALRRIETLRGEDEPFNYAAKMNLLWRAAGTEQIVLMNDDLLPGDAGWLKALVGFAMDETVGGVGGRLLYADGRLQHAGIAPIHGAIAHAWAGRVKAGGTYQDWALVQRQWSMVTGALFATRRSLLEEIDGFDERFTLEFNDIDMCLRLRALGYRIICTPEAEMTHAEKASRGETPVAGDQYALFHQRWIRWLNDDPSWHPGLRRDVFEVTPADDPGAWYR